MKTLLILASTLLIGLGNLAQAAGPSITLAKAAELSAHRIDRLVTLGKIDASFLKNLEKIEVAVVANQAPVYFKARVSQTKPAAGNPMQIDISFDQDGKPLAYQLVSGGVAGPEAGWSDIDSVTLIENCLHYILENNGDTKVALFDKSLTNITLTKGTLNGQTIARGQAVSGLTTEKLNVYLNLDGTFVSAKVIP